MLHINICLDEWAAARKEMLQSTHIWCEWVAHKEMQMLYINTPCFFAFEFEFKLETPKSRLKCLQQRPLPHFHTLKSTLNSSAQWFWPRLLWTANMTNKETDRKKEEKISLTAIFSSLRWTPHYTWEKKKKKRKKNSQQRNKLAQESSTLTLQTNKKEKSVNKKLTSK